MMLRFSYAVILLLFPAVLSHNIPKHIPDDWKWPNDPDVFRNVSELISSKGYPVEDHTVQTADGYLLSMQRIPHGINVSRSGKKQVVYLQHGLLSDSTDFVLNFPEQSLAFILADMGYEVWLGNTRGNRYSRRHIKLKPNMFAFWNYSFDQMAQYDLPAMIDYVLNVTGEKQLIYIGHSQGTTAAFALLSESPAYNEKIKLYVALAPVSTVGYITSPVKYLAPFSTELNFLLEILGVNGFFPSESLMEFLGFLTQDVCDTKLKFICENIAFYIATKDLKQLNETRIPVYIAQAVDGSSIKSIVHYGQLVNSKKFRKYDYGKHNPDHYNQTTPPDYDVSKITTPTALFWSMRDQLADVVDVYFLQRKLKSMVKSYFVPEIEFDHIDFVLAVEARKLLYEELLVLLQEYK